MFPSDLLPRFTTPLAITDRKGSPSPPLSPNPELCEEEFDLTTPPSSLPPACPFTGFHSPLSSIPDVPNTFPQLPHMVLRCMDRMQTHCIMCYFLRCTRPIKIILTHPRGGRWDECDNHASDFFRCPWRLIDNHPIYYDFSSKVSASLRLSNSGGCGWLVCSRCTEPYNDHTYHRRCIYGQEAFALAYLVWDHPPTRDSVFSFLYRNNVMLPYFEDRTTYAQWLGNHVGQTTPTLNNIHLLVAAYHLLRCAGQLPR